MYNVYEFGKRIASSRKLRGLTQEELASRLNISAQAISKWENELSFPEITILPQLASELNTTIEKLFGNEEDALSKIKADGNCIPQFPESLGGNLKLAHYLDNVGCYSEKQVDVTNGDSVVFKDGSSANLKALKIVNKGPGEICFDYRDDISFYRNIDPTKTSINKTLHGIHSLEIGADSADFIVSRSEDDNTYAKASGSPVFIDGLVIAQTEGILSIKYQDSNNRGRNPDQGNKVAIAFGSDSGKNIRVTINGNGVVEVKVPFEAAHASINGSGEITLADVDDFEGVVNGSGELRCDKAGNPKIIINGSGDYSARESLGVFKATINGSGDIDLGNGELDTFSAAIWGSGDIDAAKVSTRTANIAIEGSGDVTIGRVIEESVEKHCKGCSIKVLKRG